MMDDKAFSVVTLNLVALNWGFCLYLLGNRSRRSLSPAFHLFIIIYFHPKLKMTFVLENYRMMIQTTIWT